jgi:hypothetical protein
MRNDTSAPRLRWTFDDPSTLGHGGLLVDLETTGTSLVSGAYGGDQDLQTAGDGVSKSRARDVQWAGVNHA